MASLNELIMIIKPAPSSSSSYTKHIPKYGIILSVMNSNPQKHKKQSPRVSGDHIIAWVFGSWVNACDMWYVSLYVRRLCCAVLCGECTCPELHDPSTWYASREFAIFLNLFNLTSCIRCRYSGGGKSRCRRRREWWWRGGWWARADLEKVWQRRKQKRSRILIIIICILTKVST